MNTKIKKGTIVSYYRFGFKRFDVVNKVKRNGYIEVFGDKSLANTYEYLWISPNDLEVIQDITLIPLNEFKFINEKLAKY